MKVKTFMKNRDSEFIEVNFIERYFLIKKLSLYFYKDSDVTNFFGEMEKNELCKNDIISLNISIEAEHNFFLRTESSEKNLSSRKKFLFIVQMSYFPIS